MTYRGPFKIMENFKPIEVSSDQHTSDEQLKYKIRSINLIKYNPTLFTNREKFLDAIGGEKTALTILGFGFLSMLYRKRANALRHISPAEGVWFNTLYFLFGASVGTFYSAIYFFRWQVLANDYFAHYLIKRYKGCDQLKGKNIYHLRDVENTDEIYRFSQSFMNSFHL